MKNLRNKFIVAAVVLLSVSLLSGQDGQANEEVLPFVYEDGNKRDPFWPLVSASGTILTYENDLAASDLVLEGVISDPSGRNLAIINGRIVEPGGEIGQFTVEDIEKSRVLFRKGDQTFELKIKKED